MSAETDSVLDLWVRGEITEAERDEAINAIAERERRMNGVPLD